MHPYFDDNNNNNNDNSLLHYVSNIGIIIFTGDFDGQKKIHVLHVWMCGRVYVWTLTEQRKRERGRWATVSVKKQ